MQARQRLGDLAIGDAIATWHRNPRPVDRADLHISSANALIRCAGRSVQNDGRMDLLEIRMKSISRGDAIRQGLRKKAARRKHVIHRTKPLQREIAQATAHAVADH